LCRDARLTESGSDAAAQEVMRRKIPAEVMPGETSGEAMRRKASAEVMLLRRRRF